MEIYILSGVFGSYFLRLNTTGGSDGARNCEKPIAWKISMFADFE